jgi:hypothetical protein
LVPPKPYDVGTPLTGLGLIADLLTVYNTHVNKAAVSQQLRTAATISDFLSIAKTSHGCGSSTSPPTRCART